MSHDPHLEFSSVLKRRRPGKGWPGAPLHAAAPPLDRSGALLTPETTEDGSFPVPRRPARSTGHHLPWLGVPTAERSPL